MKPELSFQRVLIANRGIIAQRIARTCRELGLEVLMIYAPGDQHLPWLHAADQVFCCRYTDRERLLHLAQSHQAAIHPGYGFLAEDALFAAQCEAAGVCFIGPAAQILELTGHKHQCLKHLQAHGVSCLPHLALSASGPRALTAPELLQRLQAHGIALPCLVKPSAGGGGQGMMWVTEAAQLPDAIAQARSLGEQYYDCGDLLVEQALVEVRHVEVQILADHTGQLCIVGDRDCSLQRRRQKIIEEGPGLLDQSARQQLYASALTIAQALGLNQVSTLEFLWDGKTFWFLEANPRLQVEHAVTEALTGLDLVACQIACAQGMPLSEILQQQGQQNSLHSWGHAIEARLYAESPETLLPTTGKVVSLMVPTGHGLRIESCAYPGLNISPDYDGLLMKIIAHGPTREHSRRRLLQALKSLIIQGDAHLRTNQSFLVKLLENADFIAGKYHTQSATQSTALHREASLTRSAITRQVSESLISALKQSLPPAKRSECNPSPQGAPPWRPSHW